MKDQLRTSLLYVLAIVTIIAVLLLLRSRNGTSHAVLSDVRTSSVTIRLGGEDNGAPLINETASSRAATLRGFELTYIERGRQNERERTHVVSTASEPLTLHRLDQLHIKDIAAKPGTRLVIGAGPGTLDLIFDGDADCCRGRIGAGERVGMAATGDAVRAKPRWIDAASPNLLIRCAAPPCSISLDLREARIQGFIENRPAGIQSFDKPGTAGAAPGSAGVSGILGGSFELTANDLLGNEFTLRKLTLAPGDSITVEQGSSGLSLDVCDKELLINNVSDRVDAFHYRPRAGNERNMLPSLLELMLREPWRPSLFAIILGIAPGLVAFVKARMASRVKKRRIVDRRHETA
jgi:hypothetical protein